MLWFTIINFVVFSIPFKMCKCKEGKVKENFRDDRLSSPYIWFVQQVYLKINLNI